MIYWGLGEINTKIFKSDKSKRVICKFNLTDLLDSNTLVKKIKDSNHVDQISLLFVILLSGLSKVLNKGYFNIIMFGEAILSILIFVVFLQCIFRIAGGRISLKKSINLSVYIHVGVIVANICTDIPVISVITFIGAQLLGVYFQYLVGVQVAYAEIKRLKHICLIELLLILFSLVVQLLTSWGVYVAYSTKIYHFPLA